MKKTFPIILIVILALLAISLTGCNLITGFLDDMTSKVEEIKDETDKGGSTKKDYYNYGDFTEGDTKVRKYFYLSVPEVNVVEGFTFEVEYTSSTEPDLGYCPVDPGTHSIPKGWIIDDETIASYEIVDKYKCVITGLKEGVTYIHATLDSSGKDKIRTDDYKITVAKKIPTKLEISKNKTVYMEGASFNSNMQCTVTFNNDNNLKQVLNPTSIDYSAVDLNTKGTYPVTVTYSYNGTTLSQTYNVSVVDASSAVYTADYLDYTYEDYFKHLPATNLQTAYAPNSGTLKYLVIPVWFTDSSKFISNKSDFRSRIQEAFFGVKDTATGKNSVKSYYEELSCGAITIQGVVSDTYYEPGHNSIYYGVKDCEGNTRVLCGEAVEWYFSTHPSEDRTSYDFDNNGTIDLVAVLYCAPDKQQMKDWLEIHPTDPNYASYNNSTLWSMVMRGGMTSDPADPSNPNVQSCMWATAYDVLQTYNDVEIETKTYLHETGHMFGLSDYYDTADSYMPAGSRIMMDSNKGSQDPYSTLAIGWGKAIIPQTSATVELKSFQSSREMLILHPNADQCNSPFDEYIIVELYTPDGLNEFDAQAHPAYSPTEVGIRIWHVDARLVPRSAGEGYDFDHLATEPTGEFRGEHCFDNTRNAEEDPSPDEYDVISLLYYVRNIDGMSYNDTKTIANTIKNENMFYVGDTFDLESYSTQFVNGATNKLDNGEELGWSIYIEDIKEVAGVWTATIQVTQA